MRIVKAPEIYLNNKNPSVFLAGSIEMGVAENWQSRIEKMLADKDVTIFNPRRDDWDSTWIQSFDNPKFREQVEWELYYLNSADVIAMYFDPSTKSPISLLEFGLFAPTQKLIVCCPEGFWRKGNVDVVCNYYHIKQVKTINELVEETITELSV